MPTRRLALFALAALASAPLPLARAALAAKPPEPKPKDYAAIEPALRLLTLELDGPDAPGAVDALLPLLDHGKRLYRAQAAQALGSWAAARRRDLVLPALNHADPLVRALAQAAYIESNPYRDGPLVVERHLLDVPLALLNVLAELGDPQGFIPPEKLLRDLVETFRADLEGPPADAALAADLLARLSDEGARRTIIHLVDTAEGRVLAKAARAATRGRMGLGLTLLPVAFSAVGAPRLAVMRALVASPDAGLKALPLQGLSDPDPAVRRNAVRALGNLGAAAPVDALAARLAAPPTEARDAIDALGAIGGAGADALRAYLRQAEPPEPLLVATLLALAPHTTRDDVGRLSPHAASPATHVRAAALAALGGTQHPAALAAVLPAAKDPEPLVRATAAKALGQIGSPGAPPALLPMLDDPAPVVRAMAAWALGQVKCRTAAGALRRMAASGSADDAVPPRYGDVHSRPDLAAVEALGRIATDDAVACLAASLDSKSWPVRAGAARALGAAGVRSPEAVAALRRRLADPVNVVRAEATTALGVLDAAPAPGR